MSTTAPCVRVGVVILNWFTEEETIRCVRSLPGAGEGVAAVYVVDNGSDAAARGKLRRELPEAVILGEGRNTGFAAGANIGLRRALDDGCDAVLLLNNDTVMQKDSLNVLRARSDAIVNPLILFAGRPERIWFAGGSVAVHGRGLHRGFRRRSERAAAFPADSSFATACAVLLPRAVIEKVGWFDEELFAYGEDLDYSIRAGRSGVPLRFAHAARVLHAESTSVKKNEGKGFRDYYVLRNMLLLVKKHHGRAGLAVRFPILFLLEYLLPSALFLLGGDFTRVGALSRALADGLAGRTGERTWRTRG